MSKKRNKRNNKSVLKHLKAKRANFNRGGYGGGYTGGSRPRGDSQPYIPPEEERDTYQDYQDDN